MRNGPSDRLGKGDIFNEVTNGSNHYEPGETPASFDHDFVTGAGGNKTTPQRYGQGVQYHEDIGKICTFYAKLVFPSVLPMLQGDLSLFCCLGDFELNELVGTQRRKIASHPDHIGDCKKEEKPE